MDDEEDLLPEKKAQKWRIPSFLDGIIVKPDAAYRLRQVKVFGTLTLLCWVLPPISERILTINWAFAAGQIARRGMSDSEGEYNPFQKGGSHQRNAVLLMMALWVILRIFLTSLGNIRMWFGERYVGVVDATIMNIVFGTCTCYLQTYKP